MVAYQTNIFVNGEPLTKTNIWLLTLYPGAINWDEFEKPRWI